MPFLPTPGHNRVPWDPSCPVHHLVGSWYEWQGFGKSMEKKLIDQLTIARYTKTETPLQRNHHALSSYCPQRAVTEFVGPGELRDIRRH